MANYYPPRRPYYRYGPGAAPRRIPVDEYGNPLAERQHAPAERPPAPPDATAQARAEQDARVSKLAAQLEELEGQRDELRTRVSDLERELEAAREQGGKAESYLDLAQRTQADFLNYKRRAERERAEEGQAARADLLGHLLPALDDLERAVGHVPDELRDNAWAEGLPLVARQLRMALSRAGVERLGAEGEVFDPRLHEAVAYQPHPGFAEGQIAHVARPGYRLGERVIRPAQVVVAQGGEAPEQG